MNRQLRDELQLRAERICQNEIAFIYADEFASLTLENIENDLPEKIYSDDGAGNQAWDSAVGIQSRLLTPAGERHLFRLMNFMKHQANSLRSRLSIDAPCKNLIEQIERFQRIADQAREDLTEANVRLVASIAHKFSNSPSEFEDLVSDGNMILLNAIDKFDYSRGFRFSTYATHAIQRHFFRQTKRQQRRKKFEIGTPTDILAQMVPEKERDEPLDHRIAEDLMDAFDECLNEREQQIIMERFGLDDNGKGKTLKAVADRVGLSKERVRQLQVRAIEKLQNLAVRKRMSLDTNL